MGNLERYVQDDGRTMRNTLGIYRDPEAFEAALSKYSGARLFELRMDKNIIPPTFDKKHLKALHKHVLQDVFEWAGHTRDEHVTIDGDKIGPVKTMAKSGGTQFDDAAKLSLGFKVLETMLDVDKAKQMDTKTFAGHAARAMVHLNWMHPFREGNGRIQREFITQYAEASGHQLDFSVVNHERMYDVSSRSARDHYGSMTRLFEEISDKDCVARMRPAYDGFGKNPGFDDLYFSHTRPGRAVKGKFIGQNGGGFAMQSQDASIFIGDARDLPHDAKAGQMIHIMPADHTARIAKTRQPARSQI